MKTKPVAETPVSYLRSDLLKGGFIVTSFTVAIVVGINVGNALNEEENKQADARVAATEEHYNLTLPENTIEELNELWVAEKAQILSDVSFVVDGEEVTVNSLGVNFSEDSTRFMLYTFDADGEMQELETGTDSSQLSLPELNLMLQIMDGQKQELNSENL